MRLHLPKSLLAAVLALSSLPGFGAVTFDSTTELTKGVGYLLPYDKGVINLTLDSSVFATQSAGTLLVTCQAGTQGGNPIMGVAAAGEGKFETVLNESGSSFTSRVTGSSALTGSTVKVSMTSSGVTVTEDITTGEGESATTSTTTLVSESGLKYTTAPRGYTYTIAENDAIISASLSDGIIIKNLAGSGNLTVNPSVVILDGGGNENINFSMAGKALRIFGNVTLNTISTPSGIGSDIVVAEGASLTTKMLNLDWNPGSLWINGTLNSEAVELKTNETSTLSGSGAVTLGSFKTSNGGKLNSSVANFTVTGDIDLGGAGTGAGATTDMLTISGGTFKAQGTTTVRNGRTLQLGSTAFSAEGVTAAQISLNKLVVRSGGTVNMNYMKGSIASVDLQGGTFHYRDCITKDAANALGITTLTVSADSTFQKTWKGIVNVEELTGSGNLSITDRESKNNPFNLNVSKLHNYTGTISKTSSTTTLTISSVEQDAGSEGTVSIAVTLASGFTKTGEGAVSFEGTTTATDVTVSSGSLTFAGGTSISKLSLNGGTTTIGGATSVSGVKGDGIIAADDTIKLTVSDTGTLTHDGFVYTGTELSGLSHGLTLWNKDDNGSTSYNVSVTGGTITQTQADKTIHAALSGVNLINGTDNSDMITTLGANANLSSASIAGKLIVEKETTITGAATVSGTLSMGADSSITTLTGSGTLKATGGTTEATNASGFTGTLDAAGGSLTASGGIASLTAVKATGGNIILQGAADLTLTEVVVSSGKTISAYTEDSNFVNFSAKDVRVGEGGGSLIGNLSISNGGTLTLNAVDGTSGTGLTLSNTVSTLADTGITSTSGSLTLGTGLTLNLLNLNVKQGESLTLFSGVTSVNGLSDDDLGKLTAGTLAAEDVFSGVGTGDFNLSYSNNIVALVANRAVPEPTTATLSLLALMGLAARRRRRKA